MMISETSLQTRRLHLRSWTDDDAEAGLTIFGDEEVARWLSPEIPRIADVDGMRDLMASWRQQERETDPPTGHWAVTLREDDTMIGSVTLRRLPPHDEDLELAWQFAPEHWGHGYATEASRCVARWAFEQSGHELFAVVRPANRRAHAVARRLGMEWVGETDKYYDLRLQVYRLRPPDLTEDSAAA